MEMLREVLRNLVAFLAVYFCLQLLISSHSYMRAGIHMKVRDTLQVKWVWRERKVRCTSGWVEKGFSEEMKMEIAEEL